MKNLLKSIASRYGYVFAQEHRVPSPLMLVRNLHRYGLTPEHVIDIGVAYGTEWIYNSFPKATYTLIDPTKESLVYMKEWAGKLDAEILNHGLGDEKGKSIIYVRPEIGGSSLFSEVGSAEISDQYEVEVYRFDECVNKIMRPSLCKIDVQGSELMVLRGMGERIHELDVLVVETSLIATLRGKAPEFTDIHKFMNEKGFALYDIVGMTRRPLDHALAQVDAVGGLRKDPC